MMTSDLRPAFRRWTAFRAWFPVLAFLLFWTNSYLNYRFGLLIREPLSLATHVYLGASILAFVSGYGLFLGFPRRMLAVNSSQIWRINAVAFRYLPALIWFTLIGATGLTLDRFLSGAGSIALTLHDTDLVREVFAPHTTVATTISMAFFAFSFVTYCLYFLAVATRYPMRRYYHFAIYGSYLVLCLQSFLTANRGNFFAVASYVLFMLFYVRGDSVRDVLFSRRHRWLQWIAPLFIVGALIYFFFISRHRGTDDGLRAGTAWFKDSDRYGLYNMKYDELDISAFLLTYSYMTEGYQFIDCFMRHAPPFAFRPRMLVGGRTLRQIDRVLPWRLDRPEAEIIGNQWRSAEGLTIFGWPTVWGWNLAMFGYVGAVLFMFVLGSILGGASGTFLRYGNVGALIFTFSNYSILMNSYNQWGGDVFHQFGIAIGLLVMMRVKGFHAWLRQGSEPAL